MLFLMSEMKYNSSKIETNMTIIFAELKGYFHPNTNLKPNM